VCGEHVITGATPSSVLGSSPRVWGTCPIIPLVDALCRFIPTCVGNIFQETIRPRSLPVHPHVCGEHGIPGARLAAPIGSSPRVWGTFRAFYRVARFFRFIPTCVGNIPITTFGMFFPSVHPHVCGEHITPPPPQVGEYGSSPRVWGTCTKAQASPDYPSVHPHVCGEHIVQPRDGCRVAGSSPRVWGTCTAGRKVYARATVHPHVCGEHSRRAVSAAGHWRFIPTCVGNMLGQDFSVWLPAGSSPRVWGTCGFCADWRLALAVHPHVCGEHSRSAHWISCPSGSSPRVWGTCSTADFFPFSAPVHPHVCGEHAFNAKIDHCPLGSSPRVWGTFRASRRLVRRQRFIPTCVGNIR